MQPPPEEPVTSSTDTCYWLRCAPQFRCKVIPELGYAQGTCNQLWLQLPLLRNYITKHTSPLTIESGPGDGVIYSVNDHYAHFIRCMWGVAKVERDNDKIFFLEFSCINLAVWCALKISWCHYNSLHLFRLY